MQKGIMSDIHRDLGEIKANISTLTKQMDAVFSNLDDVKEASIKHSEQVKELCKKVDSYERQRITCLDRFDKVEKSTSSKALVAIGSFMGIILSVFYLAFKG